MLCSILLFKIIKLLFIEYMLCANRGSGQFVDCPAQTVDPLFAQTIQGCPRPYPMCIAGEKRCVQERDICIVTTSKQTVTPTAAVLLAKRTQMAERGNVMLSEFASNLSVSDKSER